MRESYQAALPVVEEALRWYTANPQADASLAEVITASLWTAGVLRTAENGAQGQVDQS